jgi:hypothetical protein
MSSFEIDISGSELIELEGHLEYVEQEEECHYYFTRSETVVTSIEIDCVPVQSICEKFIQFLDSTTSLSIPEFVRREPPNDLFRERIIRFNNPRGKRRKTNFQSLASLIITLKNGKIQRRRVMKLPKCLFLLLFFRKSHHAPQRCLLLPKTTIQKPRRMQFQYFGSWKNTQAPKT